MLCLGPLGGTNIHLDTVYTPHGGIWTPISKGTPERAGSQAEGDSDAEWLFHVHTVTAQVGKPHGFRLHEADV